MVKKQALLIALLYLLHASFLHAEENLPHLSELHQQTTKDQSVTARWIGENPTSADEHLSFPLEYGIRYLQFEFADNKKVIPFKPEGELHFRNGSFTIFSPDNSHVVLLQSHYGPYHVIPISNLRDYLKKKKTNYTVVTGRKPDEPGVIHGNISWVSPDSFEFNAACCGGSARVVHQINGKTKIGKWKKRN